MSKKRGFTLIELPVVRKRGLSRAKSRGLPRAQSRGFTLIELLVVMFIIALLASLVIVNVNNSRKTARDAKRVANLKSIQTALEMYNEKKGEYPVSFSRPACNSGFWCGMCSPGSASFYDNGTLRSSGADGWIPNLAPEYIPVLPTDPKSKGVDMCYLYASNGTDYMVLAHRTMETICGTGSGDTCNPVSIQEMARPVDKNQPSIAVYSSGASMW